MRRSSGSSSRKSDLPSCRAATLAFWGLTYASGALAQRSPRETALYGSCPLVGCNFADLAAGRFGAMTEFATHDSNSSGCVLLVKLLYGRSIS